MASLKHLKDIPTISHLYRTKRIVPAINTDLPKGSQEINDKISTIQYDLTKLQVDAIVNAANKTLLGGGGVDGAIHRAAGPGLLAECKTLGGCTTGSAKITDAYDLPCKKVIHAVGPIYKDENHSEPLLRACYRTALQLAVDNDCKSIAFSAISTGIYGYPSKQAAKAALREVATFLRKPEGSTLDRIVFCTFLDKDVEAYAEAIPEIFAPTEEDLAESVSALLEPKPKLGHVQEAKDEACATVLPRFGRTPVPVHEVHLDESVNQATLEARDASSEGGVEAQNEQEIRHSPDSTSTIQGTQITDADQHKLFKKFELEITDANASIESRVADDESIDDDESFVTASTNSQYGDDTVGVDCREERRGPGVRSRSASHAVLKREGEVTLDDAARKLANMKVVDCTHAWKVDDGNKSFNLWPTGRLRCINCAAVAIYGTAR